MSDPLLSEEVSQGVSAAKDAPHENPTACVEQRAASEGLAAGAAQRDLGADAHEAAADKGKEQTPPGGGARALFHGEFEAIG